MANRPPDAVIGRNENAILNTGPSPWFMSHWVDERMARLESDARTEMSRRDAVQAELQSELDRSDGVRAILAAELRAEQRTKRLLIWICGSVIAIETLALAGLLWHIWGAV
jgi:hypothetical protein